MSDQDYAVISARVPRAVLNRVDDLADSLGIKRSDVIHRAVLSYCAREPMDWSVTDESGSSGCSYSLDVHFSLPAMVYADGLAYRVNEDIIDFLSAMGAREVWTGIQSIAPLEEKESALRTYRSWAEKQSGSSVRPPPWWLTREEISQMSPGEAAFVGVSAEEWSATTSDPDNLISLEACSPKTGCKRVEPKCCKDGVCQCKDSLDHSRRTLLRQSGQCPNGCDQEGGECCSECP